MRKSPLCWPASQHSQSQEFVHRRSAEPLFCYAYCPWYWKEIKTYPDIPHSKPPPRRSISSILQIGNKSPNSLRFSGNCDRNDSRSYISRAEPIACSRSIVFLESSSMLVSMLLNFQKTWIFPWWLPNLELSWAR